MRNNPPPKRRNSHPQPARGNGRKQPPKRQQSRKPQVDANTKVRKQGNVYYVFHKSPKRVPWRLIIALFLVLLGGLGSAYSYAQIHAIQRQIAISRSELTNLEFSNRYLEAQRVESHTREQIERMAYALGMREPDPSQIIYFNVERVNRIEMTVYEPAVPVENYFWQGVVAFFRGIRDWIFGR